VYIGTDLSHFDRHFNDENKVVPRVDDVLTCVYIGALSHSYDIETVIKAVKVVDDKKIKVRFLVLGDGPLKNWFYQLATSLNAPVEFFGYLSYENMCSVLSVSDVAINAIVKGHAASITNKIGDFLASGLPMLNSMENKEFVSMVNRHGFGLNYEPGDVVQLARHIEDLALDEAKRITYGANARSVAEQFFDRNKTYQAIVELFD
jgi:glycosyltransferase involved in cell wall biosynthesis